MDTHYRTEKKGSMTRSRVEASRSIEACTGGYSQKEGEDLGNPKAGEDKAPREEEGQGKKWGIQL
eukprot:12915674-Prorocentrum_lima.AAC.1